MTVERVTTRPLDVELLTTQLTARLPGARLAVRAPLPEPGALVIVEHDDPEAVIPPGLLDELLAAHTPRPSARALLRDAVSKATTVAQVKAALLALLDERP